MKIEPERGLPDFLGDIVTWGERIPVFMNKLSFEEFARDEKTYLAVWKCVEVLGEASSRILRIDPEFETRHPQLELRSAYQMRNRLSHGYSGIDLSILWTTARNFVPPMVAAARLILSSRM